MSCNTLNVLIIKNIIFLNNREEDDKCTQKFTGLNITRTGTEFRQLLGKPQMSYKGHSIINIQ